MPVTGAFAVPLKGKGKKGKGDFWKGKGKSAWKGDAGKGFIGKGDSKGQAGKAGSGVSTSGPQPPAPGPALGQKRAPEEISTQADTPEDGVCKFFGSAKGCTENDKCPFSHDKPNSVKPCMYKQQGKCQRGDACTFRHVPWKNAEECQRYYQQRDAKAPTSVVDSQQRYNESFGQLNRERVVREPTDIQEKRKNQMETYGKAAMKMMEKMGYIPGQGLGKKMEGKTALVPVVLDPAASCSRGGGIGFEQSPWTSAMKAAAAAAAAENAANKRRKVADHEVLVHRLLSDDEQSDVSEAPLIHDVENLELPRNIEIST